MKKIKVQKRALLNKGIIEEQKTKRYGRMVAESGKQNNTCAQCGQFIYSNN